MPDFTNPDTINLLFSFGILISQVFILAVVINVIFNRNSSAVKILGKQGLIIAFLVSLFSMIGSLYMSEVANLAPCDLCWIQRIFHYSNVFILGLALFRKETYIIPYSLLLSYVGLSVAVYQVYLYATAKEGVEGCVLGGSVSCVENYFTHFGYITIPVMSVTSFVLIILFLHLRKFYERRIA